MVVEFRDNCDAFFVRDAMLAIRIRPPLSEERWFIYDYLLLIGTIDRCIGIDNSLALRRVLTRKRCRPCFVKNMGLGVISSCVIVPITRLAIALSYNLDNAKTIVRIRNQLRLIRSVR